MKEYVFNTDYFTHKPIDPRCNRTNPVLVALWNADFDPLRGNNLHLPACFVTLEVQGTKSTSIIFNYILLENRRAVCSKNNCSTHNHRTTLQPIHYELWVDFSMQCNARRPPLSCALQVQDPKVLHSDSG